MLAAAAASMAPPVAKRCRLVDEQEFYRPGKPREMRDAPVADFIEYSYVHDGLAQRTIRVDRKGVSASMHQFAGENPAQIKACAYRFAIRPSEYDEIARLIDTALPPDDPFFTKDRQSRLHSISRACHVIRGAKLMRRSGGREIFDTTICSLRGALVRKAEPAIEALMKRHGGSMSE